MAFTQQPPPKLFSGPDWGKPWSQGAPLPPPPPPPPPLAKFWSAAPAIIISCISQNRCWKVAFNHLISPPLWCSLPFLGLTPCWLCLADRTVEGGKQRNKKIKEEEYTCGWITPYIAKWLLQWSVWWQQWSKVVTRCQRAAGPLENPSFKKASEALLMVKFV